MVHQLALSQAIDGFLRFKLAAGMSPHTISDYGVSFRKLGGFLPDDPPMSQVGNQLACGLVLKRFGDFPRYGYIKFLQHLDRECNVFGVEKCNGNVAFGRLCPITAD